MLPYLIPCCFHPTKTIVVDDNIELCKWIAIALDALGTCQYFCNPCLAADFFARYQPDPFTRHVSSAQEFIAFDNRGQGLSIEYNTTELLTIQGMANDTMELINALNLTKPTVFGYSMGGMIATDLVAEYGPSLGLVIVASGSAGGPQSMPPTEEATAVLINPNATERDSLSLSFNLNNAHSRKAACNNYIASFYDVNSPQNGTTTRRQLGAVARWVSHKLH